MTSDGAAERPGDASGRRSGLTWAAIGAAGIGAAALIRPRARAVYTDTVVDRLWVALTFAAAIAVILLGAAFVATGHHRTAVRWSAAIAICVAAGLVAVVAIDDLVASGSPTTVAMTMAEIVAVIAMNRLAIRVAGPYLLRFPTPRRHDAGLPSEPHRPDARNT